MHTIIIAEIGVNHNGDISLAKKLIDSAKICGADIVKFQTFNAEKLAAVDTPKVDYQLKTSEQSESHLSMLKKLELSHENFRELKAYCDQKEIEFCSTPYSKEEAMFLCELGVKTIKVASADIVDRSLHEYLAGTNKKIILSSGMCTYKEIDETLQIYREADSITQICLLLCTSAYPTVPHDVHLHSLATLKDKFLVEVGFSDHTQQHYCALAAVALGAQVIEKHFTLDRNLIGPDHQASSTPEEFSELVAGVRTVEIALGKDSKEFIDAEKGMRLVSRKSIVTSNNLKKGNILREEDLTFQRPGTGISPMLYREFLGKRLTMDIEKGAQLNHKHLESDG